MVGLRDHHALRYAVHFDDAGVRDRIRNVGDVLGHVQHGAFAVRHAEEQHLTRKLVHAPGRAFDPVRRRERLRRADAFGVRTDCGKRAAGMRAPQDARLPPK